MRRFSGDCATISTCIHRSVSADDFTMLRDCLRNSDGAISNFVLHANDVADRATGETAKDIGPFVDRLSESYELWCQGIEPSPSDPSGRRVWKLFLSEARRMCSQYGLD
jgi:hypothetical protein